ncbi:MAG: response regulator transcription factor [Chloroflexota bacterium]
MSKTRVLLVDDHALFRDGLARILNSQIDFEVAGEAKNGLEAIAEAQRLQPDLILMDVGMPVCDGLEATQRIKQEFPNVTIVMLTVNDESEKLFEAIRNGAQGYLLKSIQREEMLSLLRGAMHGEAAITPSMAGRMLEEFRRLDRHPSLALDEKHPILTSREKEVLVLVASGASNKEVAEKLNVSIHTVKSHIRKILDKLHLTSRHEAASFAQREGLIPRSRKDAV